MQGRIKGFNDFIIEPNGTTRIILTKGQETIIDTRDFHLVKNYRWHASRGGNTFYACSRVFVKGQKSRIISMHSLLIISKKGLEIDHIDGNGLNNTLKNLRITTHQQNNWNKPASNRNTSGFRGVHWHSGAKKWRAVITVSGDIKHLGFFENAKDAYAKRINAENTYFGQYSRGV